MNAVERFDVCLEHLSEGLGQADRHAGLRGNCTGLMLPLSRKSVEPMSWSGRPGFSRCHPSATAAWVARR